MPTAIFWSLRWLRPIFALLCEQMWSRVLSNRVAAGIEAAARCDSRTSESGAAAPLRPLSIGGRTSRTPGPAADRLGTQSRGCDRSDTEVRSATAHVPYRPVNVNLKSVRHARLSDRERGRFTMVGSGLPPPPARLPSRAAARACPLPGPACQLTQRVGGAVHDRLAVADADDRRIERGQALQRHMVLLL